MAHLFIRLSSFRLLTLSVLAVSHTRWYASCWSLLPTPWREAWSLYQVRRQGIREHAKREKGPAGSGRSLHARGRAVSTD